MGSTAGRTVCLKIGIWNGAQTVGGQLLYRRLLTEAMNADMRGGTVSTHVEGSQRRLTFRSVGSEVTSNELPLWMELVDGDDKWPGFVADARKTIGRHGIIVSETVEVCNPTPGQEAGEFKERSPSTQPRSSTQRSPSTQPSLTREGLEVQVYSLEGNKVGGRPVYQAAAAFLRAKNIFWISIARGLCGYGDGRRIHKAHWFSRSSDIPIVMTVVDFQEHLAPHVEALAQLVGDQGLVSFKPVTWLHPTRL